MALCRGQRAFVEPARLHRAPAREPHVRQHDGRAQLVRDHAGRVQAGDRLAERFHRGAEVAGGPCRQADEAGGGTAREVVLRSGERECPACVRDRAVDVASGLGDRGAVDRGHGREGADLVLPVPGCLGQRARRRDRRWRRRIETGLCGVEPRLHPVDVALGEPAPPHVGGEQRSATYDADGQRDQPVTKGAVLAASAHVGQGQLDQAGGVFVVAAGDRVPYGIAQQPVVGQPSAGRGVQLADPVGVPGSQTGTQCVGEQMVVAEPAALVVERDDEQVLALEGLQHQLTVGAESQGVAQTAAQLVEHGGVEQEGAYLVRLPAQNLLNQVVEDEPMASREGLDKPSDVSTPVGGARMGPGRQRRQLQPGRPPLCARLERGHQCRLQLQPHHLVEEHLRFIGGEPEVRRPHLHELATARRRDSGSGGSARVLTPGGEKEDERGLRLEPCFARSARLISDTVDRAQSALCSAQVAKREHCAARLTVVTW